VRRREKEKLRIAKCKLQIEASLNLHFAIRNSQYFSHPKLVVADEGRQMDVPIVKKAKINRWLPYWAVFQADVRQTAQSWVYRTWVLVSLLAIAGYLIFRYGPYHEAGLVQSAAGFFSDLLRWTVLGSAAVVVVLAGGSISAERGTMADSVLSRGISRYQYFLGKWHARLVTVLGTYLALGLLAMTCGLILFHEDLSLVGGLVALATVAALLAAVITCGVTVSAIATARWWASPCCGCCSTAAASPYRCCLRPT
jgi:hypothetical protein